MSNFIDYYEVLGVPFDASAQEIKKAYRQIAKECHPDLCEYLSKREQEERVEKFKKANNAYEVLSDSQKKAKYDNDYILHQQRQNRSYESEEVPFWEKPNWGGHTRGNRYDDNCDNQYDDSYNQDDYDEEGTYYYGMSDIMREAFSDVIETYYDVKEEEYSFSERVEEYRNAFKHIKHMSLLKKGFIVFGSELLYSAEKLKIKRNDDTCHYVIRNRGKALVAAGLVIALTTGMFVSSEEKTTESPIPESQITETLPIENPTLTIMRTYTVDMGDTLSGLAEEANCTRQEIKDLNSMNTDGLYYQDTIIVPYHIPEDEIGRYTTVELYNGENLYDFAETYETDPESLQKLNPDTIIEVNDSYAVTSDTIVIPTFAPYDYNANKAK